MPQESKSQNKTTLTQCNCSTSSRNPDSVILERNTNLISTTNGQYETKQVIVSMRSRYKTVFIAFNGDKQDEEDDVHTISENVENCMILQLCRNAFVLSYDMAVSCLKV